MQKRSAQGTARPVEWEGGGGDREACVWRGELPRWQVRASLCLALPAGCAESHHSPDGEPR